MRSSTSSFKELPYSRAIVLLLIAVLVYFVALEILTNFGLKRVSQAGRRVHEDYLQALTLRPLTYDGHKTVLVVGNSLLVAGVERKRLAVEMSPEFTVTMLPIENTTYLDWYFGLRRLFAEGARPSAVILCLSPRQLISDSVNGEDFAHRMMQLDDIQLVRKAAGLDMTTTSAFFFANLSSWLGGRNSIRNWILEIWLPKASLLAASLTTQGPLVSESQQRDIVIKAEHRLHELRDFSATYGARFVYLVPPQTSRGGLSEQIRLSAGQSGLSVVIPYLPGEMAPSYFVDGFHLNPVGASVFTDRLRPMLQSSLR